jgi:UDP-arabinose 4-epimerase
VSILISGGAGYIGSQTAKSLSQAGFEPVVYDNLSTGNRWAVQWGPFVEADLCNPRSLRETLKKYNITAAIHFAAHAYVGESVREPRRYFENNVMNTLHFVHALLDEGVNQVVFSSSCAVYGVPECLPISESHSRLPVNPYGDSKLFIERVLNWYGRAYGLRWAALRYFNAAGADPSGELGEVHNPETHLVPRLIEATLGRLESVEIYGIDYPTKDGTAIRDYVHVLDLAEAHVAALQRLISGGESFSANLGTGQGVSVREVISAVERVSGTMINAKTASRREGDPPVLIADPTSAGRILGWHPRHSSLDSIVRSAWDWHRRLASLKHIRP